MFLFIAGLIETGWVVSLKLSEGFTKIIPIIFYGLCGIGAAFFFSKALKVIPMATSYSIWVGVTIVGTSLVDYFAFKEPMSVHKFLFILLIVIGIGGLKATSKI